MRPRHAAVLALAAVLAAVALTGPAAARRPPTGPPGERFYTPPRPLPGERHGDVVRARRLRGGAALGGAAETLVLYRSRGLDGSAIAVSGAVAVPRGRPPRGGWPVVSYAHGTTGIADACAPTRSPEVNPPSGYPDALLRPWLRAGFAVLRTDYQGLGTPGVHQYLVGAAEARSVLDVVRAARRLHPRVSRRVVLAGHSQGGHAALWAAALAPSWTPELRIRGTVALAPASHVAVQARSVSALTRPGQLSAIAGLILRGLGAARPALRPDAVLSDRARALYPHTSTRCLAGLGRPDSLGGLAPAALFAPGADLGPLVRALAANDPEHLGIRTPVRVEQGTTDEVTFPAFTDALVEAYRARGVPVSYRTHPGADHIAVVRAAAPGVNRWVARRLRR